MIPERVQPMPRCARRLLLNPKYRLYLLSLYVQQRITIPIDSTLISTPVLSRSGIQGKEQSDEGYRGAQEDSGAQRKFWGETLPPAIQHETLLCRQMT